LEELDRQESRKLSYSASASASRKASVEGFWLSIVFIFYLLFFLWV
jgi:hypothetical protein